MERTERPLVGVVMGSASDWPTLRQAAEGLGSTGLSLNNGGDTVDLLLSNWVGGDLESLDVVHSVTYADHEADDETLTAMVRERALALERAMDAWIESESASGSDR